jgi:hypothetical protein
LSALSCATPLWWAEFGDPTAWGWAMTLGYGLAALMAALRWRGEGVAARGFWAVMAAIVAGVAINTQADLQILLIALGRCLALEGGWFEARRAVQAGVFGALVLAALVLLGWLMARRRAGGPGAGLALAGLASMAIYVAWRAAEFLHVEGEALHALSHMHVPLLFEAGGAVAIALGARRDGSRR